ncbi:MAG: hypothetical protein JXA42_02285 [Anaerolineales bacterium]|nr:hypothetical protein [Anaerolineales bacterium]
MEKDCKTGWVESQMGGALECYRQQPHYMIFTNRGMLDPLQAANMVEQFFGFFHTISLEGVKPLPEEGSLGRIIVGT